MKHIVSLSIGSSSHNGESIIRCGDKAVRLTRLGADEDFDLFHSWLEDLDGHCDLIALNGLPPPIKVGKKVFCDDLLIRTQAKLQRTPSVYGNLMQGMVLAWAIEQAITDGRLSIKDSAVTMLSSFWQQDLLRVLQAQGKQVQCLDPWIFLGIPHAFSAKGPLSGHLLQIMSRLERNLFKTGSSRSLVAPFKLSPTMRKALRSDVMVVSSALLGRIDSRIFCGKTVVLDHLTHDARVRLEEADVYNAYAVKFTWRDAAIDLSASEIEALLMCMQGEDEPLCLDDVVQSVVEHRIGADLVTLYPERREPIRKFAFVVHPLSRSDLFRHPLLKPLKSLPEPAQKIFERSVAHSPGLRYGTVRGVVSKMTGVEVEGLLYSLFATPREMLSADPHDVYNRLVRIAEHAEAQGARILGLGAFTKIVGDAGVTVSERCPIPVTTGNSLSVAATLWAARDICQKLGFVRLDQQKKEKVKGRAMIIGATGSIGKACAKIISNFFPEVVLAATNAYRLMQVSREIEEECSDIHIKVTTNPDRYAQGCDLIVIATSATAGGVLDIALIKPGCVVCDVSRPLTFTAEQAMQRPDVLIVESGEIDLPGTVHLDCDIGLTDSVVYACLAETALLALEGRFESFSLSRHISTKKVVEIYKLAKKHGVRLAEVRGPCGLVTDQEISLCREHAEKKLSKTAPRGRLASPSPGLGGEFSAPSEISMTEPGDIQIV